MVTIYPLTERQKNLLRSITPGLEDDTLETTWTYFYAGGQIEGINNLPVELWRNVWKGVVTEADFDDFVQCNFFRQRGERTYTLNTQLIIDAVKSNFGDGQVKVNQGTSIPSKLTIEPLFGRPVPTSQFQCDIFVIMPFADEFKPVYDDAIKPLGAELNLKVRRADDFFSKHDIMTEIWSAIFASSFLIADCSGRNPNVFYELGIAHTLGRPAILIAQNEKDIPFDIRGKRYIVYEDKSAGIRKLQAELKKAIVTMLKDLEENGKINA